jgi:hypothetical protein
MLQGSRENISLPRGSDREAVGAAGQGEWENGDRCSFQSALRRRGVGGGGQTVCGTYHPVGPALITRHTVHFLSKPEPNS